MPTEQSFSYWSVLTPVLTAILSIVVSVIVTSVKNRTELKKIKLALQHSFSKSLFDKRVNDYPGLYKILSSYLKTINEGKSSNDNLRKFLSDIEDWDNQHALLFTKDTCQVAYELRTFIKSILDKSFSSKDWELLQQGIFNLERCLRAEIGTFDTEIAGKKTDIYRTVEAITESLTSK